MYLQEEKNGFKKRIYNNSIQYLVILNGRKQYMNQINVYHLASKKMLENVELKNNRLVKVDRKFKLCNINSENYEEVKSLDYTMAYETLYLYDEYYESSEYDHRIFNDKKLGNNQEILNKYKLVYYGEELISILYFKCLKGYKIFDIIWYKDFIPKFKIVQFVAMTIKDSIFGMEPHEEKDALNYGLKIVDMKSSLDKEKEYELDSHGEIYVTYYDTKIIINAVENKHKVKFKKEDLKVIYCNNDKKNKFIVNLYNRVSNNEVLLWSAKYSSSKFIGFRYFSLDDIYKSNSSNLLILCYQDIIVGVVKFKEYKNENAHTGMGFLEINKFYRSIELENYLITKLNNYLDKNLTLVLPADNEEEALTKLSERIKKLITVTKVKTYDDCISDGHYY